jgi:uncharacterized protein YecE (DUF72 family)
MMQGDIRVGLSGRRYQGWRGVFYPKDLPHRQELSFVASKFRAAEINGTFYSLQRPPYFERWAAEVPDNFVFAIKGSRFITHNKKLNDIEVPLANFFAQGVLGLGKKTGPFLWQFSPRFRFAADRLDNFFKLLPRDTDAASKLARRHDSRVKGKALLKPKTPVALRHAIEVRHDSFINAEFIRLLRSHDIALVCADTVAWPRLMDVTSNFVYCRLHGSKELYASGYDLAELDQWATRVLAWAGGAEPADAERVIDKPARKRAGRDVFVFFDNDAKVRAPFDAAALIERLHEGRLFA